MDEIRFSRTKEIYPEFSNFYECDIEYDGLSFKSVEAAWQAQKAVDKEIRRKFCKLPPNEAKRLGRNVVLRYDWECIKLELMLKICRIKFKDKRLRALLLSTGDAILIENTTGWHDNYYGWCECEKCRNKEHKNRLGTILMQIRDELKKESEETI